MTTYFSQLAAAFVRGQTERGVALPRALSEPALEALREEECAEICGIARRTGLRIHAFKRTVELPRVRRVLGILRGMSPGSVLDLGSGRGVFLWPLLDALPGLSVVAVERDGRRCERIAAVRRGGVTRLGALRGDVTALSLGDDTFDVVTLLEVAEHVPDYRQALAEALRVARRCVVLSVPSKADDNPEHIHLFTAARLEGELRDLGAARVTADYVLNHLIVVARPT